MTLPNARMPLRRRLRWIPLLATAALALTACSGGTGGSGAQGPSGPTGPSGPPGGGGVPESSSGYLKATIASARVGADGRTVLDVRIANDKGQPVTGILASNVSFALGRLEPGVNGKPSTWHALTRRTEAFPGTPAPVPADKVTGTGPKNQGYTEAGTAGTWTESANKNGQYDYTFALNLKGIADIPYDGTLVHRVGLEIRGTVAQPLNNGVYTWVPDPGYPVAQSGREIVDNSTCNACHQRLQAHGGARIDVQYCAMCHDSYSYDAQTGNPLALKTLIHKIHSGENTLPSVAAGGSYGIFGYGNTYNDFSHVAFPANNTNCDACHRESDAAVPQGSNYRLVVSRENCTACHDDVNFTTGANHGAGGAATDDECTACHGPNSTLANGKLRPETAHPLPELTEARKFKFEVVKVEAIKADGTPGATACAAATAGCKVLPGEFAKVTIRVSNPQTGALYKITDPAFTNVIPCTPVPPATTCSTTPARLRVRVAYTTQNFTNPASGNTPAQPIAIDYLSSAPAPVGAPAAAGGLPVLNADGTYTKAAPKPIPSGLLGGTGEAFLEGRAIVDVSTDPTAHAYVEAGVTASAGVNYPITDATAVARRQVVDTARCDKCHYRLSFHGANRNDNVELCTSCHNPELALGATQAAGEPFDFKLFIHGIHSGTYVFGSLSFADVVYPGHLANCEGCHKPGTYYPVDPAKVFATSVSQGANAATPSDDLAYTANAAACGGCHNSSFATTHISSYGGSWTATKNADGTTPGAGNESCGSCHGAGGVQDVKQVHGVAIFPGN